MSDNAADYLMAIARQPLLAVGALAPELYGRVPALARAHELRLRSSRALSAARGAGPAASARVRWLPGTAGGGSAVGRVASPCQAVGRLQQGQAMIMRETDCRRPSSCT